MTRYTVPFPWHRESRSAEVVTTLPLPAKPAVNEWGRFVLGAMPPRVREMNYGSFLGTVYDAGFNAAKEANVQLPNGIITYAIFAAQSAGQLEIQDVDGVLMVQNPNAPLAIGQASER